MKNKIHPTYHKTTVTCACGNTFETGSTLEDIRVEICSNCHPFFTGKQKLIDTARRVDRFESLRTKSSELREQVQKTKAAKVKRQARAKKPVAEEA